MATIAHSTGESSVRVDHNTSGPFPWERQGHLKVCLDAPFGLSQQVWLLHSPLLEPSQLLSHPPLNDMLKFGG